MTVSSATRVLALLGDPVAHSLSPVIQNAAFRAAGMDGVYVALRTRDDDLRPLMVALSRAGGGGNVTLPHKERAATVVDRPSDAVRRTGACNTFWGEEDEIHGDNTDVEGFRRALRDLLGRRPEGARTLLLGAGGAARAALVALLDDGVSEVQILNRSTERARAVARRIGGERARVVETPTDVHAENFDIVVNATRLGLSDDDALPLELSLLERAGVVMDMVYGAGDTAFVRAARQLGIRAEDGGGMLVRQAAVAFERWWGEPGPIDSMDAALARARSPGAVDPVAPGT